jgi:hypothetical protein
MGPLEYETGLLTTRPRRSMTFAIEMITTTQYKFFSLVESLSKKASLAASVVWTCNIFFYIASINHCFVQIIDRPSTRYSLKSRTDLPQCDTAAFIFRRQLFPLLQASVKLHSSFETADRDHH